ncbi:hypothetical protein QAD02_006820 [Eretmocerus hayati]|uniref:Uncharacterized protein n=1 Tax=Eretmocerus hayati TaxID=131215 RepID=A0ACC2N2D9_9HYME|nr:hypothetical protein QAD02_006820 [Eretmocerus hayati]
MYDICHPAYYNMSQLGCNDQVKLTTAFYVYMELCEVRRYWNVDYKYSDKLQLFHLEAKKTANGAVETYIPWPTIHNITLDLIGNIQTVLDRERFTFVFKEGDSTSAYYAISSGIKKPVNPEDLKPLKLKDEKKFILEREINRNTANLYERALLFGAENDECVDNHETDNLAEQEE